MNDPEDPGGAGGPLERIAITDEQSVAVDLPAIERIASHTLRRLCLRGALSIALVEPSAIADLKGRYYGEQAATDVLSFAMDGPAGPTIGDVVVCPAVAARQARGLGRSLDEEIAQLVVHGILHLAGREHDDPAGEIAMAAEERSILLSA